MPCELDVGIAWAPGRSTEAAGSVSKLRIDRRYSVNCRSWPTVPELQLRPATGDAAARSA